MTPDPVARLFEVNHPQTPEAPRAEAFRRAVRGVVLRGDEILLLYTARYDDYSLPGGGVDDGEALDAALIREIEEETGASDVRVVAPLGWIDERRPHRGNHDAMRMHSFIYLCDVAGELGETRLEHYERGNGMRPLWIDLEAAIAHNRTLMARRDAKMGLSIERETRILEWVWARRGKLLRLS